MGAGLLGIGFVGLLGSIVIFFRMLATRRSEAAAFCFFAIGLVLFLDAQEWFTFQDRLFFNLICLVISSICLFAQKRKKVLVLFAIITLISLFSWINFEFLSTGTEVSTYRAFSEYPVASTIWLLSPFFAAMGAVLVVGTLHEGRGFR